MFGKYTSHLAVSLFLMSAGFALATAESPPVPHDAAYQQAREQMADVLASEDFTQVDVSAGSFEMAMSWIYMSVDSYLDRAIPILGGVVKARDYGVEVLRGLNEHRVRYSEENGHDLVGDRVLRVSQEKEAVELGELLFRVAAIIHEAHIGGAVNIQIAAKKTFEGMLPTAGTGQPLISQYLVQLRTMTEEERQALIRHLRQ